MSIGTPEYWRARGILYTATKIGNSMLSTARSGFDAGCFKGVQVRDPCYPVVACRVDALVSIVRFRDSLRPRSKASLLASRNGKERKASYLMLVRALSARPSRCRRGRSGKSMHSGFRVRGS
jgi:hypothetical protein